MKKKTKEKLEFLIEEIDTIIAVFSIVDKYTHRVLNSKDLARQIVEEHVSELLKEEVG